MPPKAKFTKEQITKAALCVVSEKGAQALTAKELGAALGTSTTPIFTVFNSMQEVQDAVGYINSLTGDDTNIIFGIREGEADDDSVTIAVIATGLQNAGASGASDLLTRMNYGTPAGLRTAAARPAAPAARPASSAASAPRTSFGTARPASTVTAGLHTPTAGAAPSAAQTADLREKLNHPVQPRATVRQEDIKVPDFLKSKQL